MNKQHRKIYFWFIFTLTIALIATLLFYSSGYRFNFKKFELIKTGSLYLESIPKNTTIYIDEKPYEKNTPALINNLPPNEYIVSLKKDGYFSWQKKLTIESTKTTFADKILLIKNNTTAQKINKNNFPAFEPKEIITTEIANIINDLNLSSNIEIKNHNNLLTILDNQSETLYLVKNNNDHLEIKKFSQKIKGFTRNSENENKLLFYNNMEIWSYDNESKQEELVTRQSEAITEAIWIDQAYIIYSETNKIKLLELDGRDWRQCYELATTENAYNLILDKKQKNLFWQTENNYWQLNLLD